MMNVTIDSREQKRIKPAIFFYSQKYNTSVEELKTGDYLFTHNDTNKKCVFEYKTIHDFINSVNDGRVFNQALKQSEDFDYHFVIIEGTEQDRQKITKELWYSIKLNFTKQQFYGAIARLNTYTTVIQCPDLKTCLQMMQKQAMKCFDNKNVTKSFKNKSKGSPAFRFFVNEVNGVGEDIATSICDSCGVSTLSDLLGLSKEDLLGVSGVGDKTADKILNQLK